MKPPTTLTSRRTFWAEHVQAWRSSGFTQVAYSPQNSEKIVRVRREVAPVIVSPR